MFTYTHDILQSDIFYLLKQFWLLPKTYYHSSRTHGVLEAIIICKGGGEGGV
jgi:hypothetical protein